MYTNEQFSNSTDRSNWSGLSLIIRSWIAYSLVSIDQYVYVYNTLDIAYNREERKKAHESLRI